MVFPVREFRIDVGVRFELLDLADELTKELAAASNFLSVSFTVECFLDLVARDLLS